LSTGSVDCCSVDCVCNSLKVEVLEVEVHLDNAGRFDPGAQYILLSGRVVAGAKTIQVVKETDTTSSRQHQQLISQTAHQRNHRYRCQFTAVFQP